MSRWLWPGLFFVYFILAAVLYNPSLKGPWQFDDHAQILDKPVLMAHSARDFFINSFRILPETDGRLTNRDFVRGTFRLNWDWWGEKTGGYRWVNLAIHVVNASLVSLLIWLLLESSAGRKSADVSSRGSTKVKVAYERGRSGRRWRRAQARKKQPSRPLRLPRLDLTDPVLCLSVFTGLFFLIHPVQSQAVAYIAQRFTSLATMFYLGAVVAWLMALRSKKGWFWYLAALLSALLSYSSKEISVTLPVILFLLTVVFSGERSSLKILVRNSLFLIPFFLFSLKIPLQVAWSSADRSVANLVNRQVTAEQTFALKQKAEELTRRDYALTQISVIRTYLRLIILPIRQSLDWDYPITTAMDIRTALSLFLHLSLISSGLYLVVRRRRAQSPKPQPQKDWAFGIRNSEFNRLIGVGILWFYLTILPESSFIPIIDVIYEHRVYLPFVGVCLTLAGVAGLITSHRSSKTYWPYITALAALWLGLLATATVRRAWIWGDEVRLWADVYAKAPHKARASKNYGVVLAVRGKYSEGIARLKQAVELEPDNADYWSNLGTAYLRAELYEEASGKFRKAYELYAAENSLPDFGSQDQLEVEFDSERRQQAAQYLNDYGVTMVRLKRGEEALRAFEQALDLDPELYAAWLGLGAAKNLVGDAEGAIEIFEELVQRAPDQEDGYNNLATMYRQVGRDEDANRIELELQQISRDKIEE